MKIKIKRADERGFANHGWLQANHSFSFANYYDPNSIQFGALRVLNDDLIAPSMGFGTHPHDNMEIITIPFKGLLKHKDSMAGEWLEVKPGEVQVMSAGSGLSHSEINGSSKEHLSLFQIWIMPNQQNVEPRYDQKSFDPEQRKDKLQTLVSSLDNDSDNGSLKIHQNAKISRIDLSKDNDFEYKPESSTNGVYIMTISGSHKVGEEILNVRDAIGIWDTEVVHISANEDSDLLFIEVPMN
ncbi:MAG: pirin family protein [Bacteroidia bacterium]|nr:pirin family protein [Bacteroidia bacterium]